MPTLPVKATPIPEILQRAFEMIANTAPFDVTGHPAMTLPSGLNDGLPVEMMLIGKHYAEKTIYQAAHAYEQGFDWRTQ